MEQQGLAEAIDAIRSIWLTTARAAGDALTAYQLTPALWEALAAINPDEAPPSMKVMAERLHCNASNLSFIANQLATRGLVTQSVDDRDRRSRILILTAEGRSAREALIQATLRHSPLARLGALEMDTLNRVLSRVTPPLEK